MPMHRRPPAGGRPCTLPTRPLVFLLGLALLASAALIAACQKDDDGLLRPGDITSNVVRADYVSPEDFFGNEIKMDGEAKDREWGGPLDPVRSYTQVRMSAENGSGDPGEPIYAAVKAVYTDNDLFMLVRWPDAFENSMKDVTYYVGPDLTDRHGCQSVLMREDSWSQDVGRGFQDEDRLVLAWEMGETGDSRGLYRHQGCQIACHPGSQPAFGRPGFGKLDVWQWLACRTNPVRYIYTRTDNPNFPVYGTPGYLDDYACDPVSGLAPDPGRPCWLPNLNPGSARPRWVYREFDDPFYKPGDPSTCLNSFGEKCRQNNGLPIFYIWREDIERIPGEFVACDSVNFAVLPQGRDARKWRPGDPVTAYYYTYPTESRADVRGRAGFSEGVWTLELARRLNTGDPANDVIFRGEPGERIVFTVAVASNSRERHWGSGPQVLEFGPKEKARGAGAARAAAE